MALYYLTVKYVSRQQGRSAVGAAAYRAGEKLHNEYDGLTHDYTRKSGIVHTEIMLPDNAPSEYLDRQTLWNAVEKAEKRKDARTAREVVIALPNELTLDEQTALAREFVRDNFTSKGMCADVAIHSGNHGHRRDETQELPIDVNHDTIIYPRNPHAHILVTTRHVGREGFGRKNRDWDKKENLLLWREEWAKAQNREYERKGLEISVSHETLAKQGLDREPTKHLGHEAAAMERRGIHTHIGNENRAIEARNRERETSKERDRRRWQEREQNRQREKERDRRRQDREEREERDNRRRLERKQNRSRDRDDYDR
jgi:ATP-dependent exoDNAse (exonuclease V) alpha subunit